MSSVNLEGLGNEDGPRMFPTGPFALKGDSSSAPVDELAASPEYAHLNPVQKITAAMKMPAFVAKYGKLMGDRHSFVRDAAANAAEHAKRAAEDGNVRVVLPPEPGGANPTGAVTEAQKEANKRVLEARALISSGYGKAASWNGTEQESAISKEIEEARRAVEANKDPKAVESAQRLLANLDSALCKQASDRIASAREFAKAIGDKGVVRTVWDASMCGNKLDTE